MVITENVHLKKEMEVSIKTGEIVGLLYDAFPYVNGDLFENEEIEISNLLLEKASEKFDWSEISSTIF